MLNAQSADAELASSHSRAFLSSIVVASIQRWDGGYNRHTKRVREEKGICVDFTNERKQSGKGWARDIEM